jgi:Family of unknown function (DUF5372)
MLRQRERAATFRCDLGFRIVSSNRITAQVVKVPLAEAFANLPQLNAGGREEAVREQVPRADYRATPYLKPSSAPDPSGDCQTFEVNHPFHPLRGRKFTLVMYRRSWGEHRVYFLDDTGRLVSLPAQWTSVFPVDPYVAVAAGRAPFRLHDLLELSELIARIRHGETS